MGCKQINRVQKSSWNTRCIGASLHFQFGPDWSPIVWKLIFREDANPVFAQTYSMRLKAYQITTKYAKSAKGILARRKRKYQAVKSSGEGKQFYGDDAQQVEKDLTLSELANVKQDFYQAHVVVTKEEAISIEVRTRKQDNDEWLEGRRIRLTTTTTAAVRKRQKKTPLAPLVESHLYPKPFSNKHTDYGLKMESVSEWRYKEIMKKKGTPVIVESSGLVIHQSKSFLAASPDGLVIDESEEQKKGLVEYKSLSASKIYISE